VRPPQSYGMAAQVNPLPIIQFPVATQLLQAASSFRQSAKHKMGLPRPTLGPSAFLELSAGLRDCRQTLLYPGAGLTSRNPKKRNLSVQSLPASNFPSSSSPANSYHADRKRRRERAAVLAAAGRYARAPGSGPPPSTGGRFRYGLTAGPGVTPGSGVRIEDPGRLIAHRSYSER
jgi:hypothetical protein